MALRMVEIVVPASCADRVLARLEDEELPEILGEWTHDVSDDRRCIRVLVEAENTESLTDAIVQSCGASDDFRIALLPVEATLPKPEEPEADDAESAESTQKGGRISREELYADVSDSARVTYAFLIMVALSALVAVIGLTRSSVVIIIGAMVIAPLLGPNVALSLATALADVSLAWKSLRSLLVGLGLSLAVAAVAGLILRPSPDIPEIASRTSAGWGDVLLAIASGAAGGLTYTTGIPTALVGVMVAVALLPPWVAFGMLVGAAEWHAALGALLLTGLNLICLNLTGVLTFVLQGVSPAKWWEAKKARRMSIIAISAWGGLLAVLIFLLFLARLP